MFLDSRLLPAIFVLVKVYFYAVLLPHQILKQYWGYDKFRPLQEEIIQSVLQGKDTLALLPTGGGKSICFQVPALALDGLCLVVSPLIALMNDQVQNLQKKGIKAAAIHSGLSLRDTDTLLDNCVYGSYKFLYVSPERLTNEMFRARLAKMKVSLLAVDEAHCISQWGYDFRPPYLKIAEVRALLPNVPLIALTATATLPVVKDIQEKLHFKSGTVFQKSFVRSNLSYVVRKSADKHKTMLEILHKVPGTSVVYVRNRRKTKEAASFLQKHGISADYYHAGLTAPERNSKQDAWIKNKIRVICCTNAFGMGIDKPDVRTVIHLDPCESLEAYFQEAGRAGRDEKKSFAVLLYDAADVLNLQAQIEKGYPSVETVREVYEKLCIYFRIAMHHGTELGPLIFDIGTFCDAYRFSPYAVLQALQILVQHEVLLMSEDFRGSTKVKMIAAKETLFHFQQQNKNLEPLIKYILRTAEGVFEDDVSIDELGIAARLKISIEELALQLQTLQRLQILRHTPRKELPTIFFQQNRIPANELRLNSEWIQQRKQNFEDKLTAVKQYINNSSICRTRQLVRYFEETIATDCGVCDVCVASKKANMSSVDFQQAVEQLTGLLQEKSTTVKGLQSATKIKQEDFRLVMDYLADNGLIYKNQNDEWALSQ